MYNTSSTTSLKPKAILNIAYINVDFLSFTKWKVLESNLESDPNLKNADAICLSEIGSLESLNLLESKGWIISKPPTTRAEGVAILLRKKLIFLKKEINVVSARTVAIKIIMKRKRTLSLIFTYAPTMSTKVNTTEIYTNHCEEIFSQFKKGKKNDFLLVGDLNAKIGRKNFNVTGKYGLHHFENKHGKILLNFFTKFDLAVCNSFFKTGKKNVKKSIFNAKHATYRQKNLTKIENISELDLVVTKRKKLGCVQKCRVSWNVIGKIRTKKFDHAMLCTRFVVKNDFIRKFEENDEMKIRFLLKHDLWKFVEKEINDQEEFKIESDFSKKLKSVLKEVRKVYKKFFKKFQVKKHNLRTLTENAVKLIRKRERSTSKHVLQKINENLKKEGLKSYKTYLKNLGKEAENAFRKNDLRKSFQMINKMIKKKTTYILPTKKFKTHHYYKNLKEVVKDFEVYYRDIFKENPNLKDPKELDNVQIPFCHVNYHIPTLDEIVNCIKKMKKNKATGPDLIPIEVFQSSKTLQNFLAKKIQKIWKSKKIDETFASGETIMLFKNKKSSDDLKNYRPITLLNHSFKVLTRLINDRLKKLVRKTLLINQTGFREKVGTTDAYTSLQKILRQMFATKQNVAVTFLDLQKAFDKISRKFLFFSLKEHHVPKELITLIEEIYTKANVKIKIGKKDEVVKSEKIKIKNGVLQGDTLSPTLFIITLDSIIRRISDCERRKFLLNKLIFADDIAMISTSVQEIFKAFREFHDLSWYTGLKISYEKTKVMWTDHVDSRLKLKLKDLEELPKLKFKCSTCVRTFASEKGLKIHLRFCKKENANVADVLANRKTQSYKKLLEKKKERILVKNKQKISVNGQKIEIVSKFKYLGVTLTADSSMKKDVEIKISRAKEKMRECLNFIYCKEISRKTKISLVQTLIISIVLYGCEAWDLEEEDIIKALKNFSREIKRVLYDPKNFRIKLDENDLDLNVLARKRKNDFYKRLEKINSPAALLVKNKFELDEKISRNCHNNYKELSIRRKRW